MGKWFCRKGSVRNLNKKKCKKFRIDSFVRNLDGKKSKKFRTDSFVRNHFRFMPKRVSHTWFRTKLLKVYSDHKEALTTDKSFPS